MLRYIELLTSVRRLMIPMEHLPTSHDLLNQCLSYGALEIAPDGRVLVTEKALGSNDIPAAHKELAAYLVLHGLAHVPAIPSRKAKGGSDRCIPPGKTFGKPKQGRSVG